MFWLCLEKTILKDKSLKVVLIFLILLIRNKNESKKMIIKIALIIWIYINEIQASGHFYK